MVLTDISRTTVGALRGAGDYLVDLVTPTVRLGVTGLARAGKTIFITALVRNLVEGGRLPFFGPLAEGRIVRAYLEPQPDDRLPRFAYEDHLAALAADPPQWPESTRRISQLRVTIEYRPTGLIKRTLGASRLHLDIVDYPGEWLIDLPMLEQSFVEWSNLALEQARAPHRAVAAGPWLAFLDGLDPAQPHEETVAIEGARRFTEYLERSRSTKEALSVTGPGRFLMPGDLAGSPLLTFFPVQSSPAALSARNSLARQLERRYEAYRTHVVRPFFREHFARLDRQIVLLDVLSALDAGPDGLKSLETAITAVMRPFRPGRQSWLGQLIAPRIDRVAFAATKADHLPSGMHDRLEALLARLTERAEARIVSSGAEIKALALAALRATREGEVKRGGETLPCLIGTPLPGEKIGEERFDGRRSAAIFPGDLPTPAELDRLFGADGKEPGPLRGDIAVVRFRPPRIGAASPSGAPQPWPHVRLDRALEFLIGDRLA